MEEYFFVISDNGDTVDRVKVSDINYIALWATQLPSIFEYKEFPGYYKALENYYADNYDRYKECYQRIVATDEGKAFLDTTINLVLLRKQIEKIIKKPMKNKTDMDDKKIEQYTNLLVNWEKQLEINQTTFASEYVDHVYYRRRHGATSSIDDFKNKAKSYINWLDNLSRNNPELAKEHAIESLIAAGVLNEDGSQKEHIVDYPPHIGFDENEEFGNRCEYALIDSIVLNEDGSPKEYAIDYLNNILLPEKSKQKIKKK